MQVYLFRCPLVVCDRQSSPQPGQPSLLRQLTLAPTEGCNLQKSRKDPAMDLSKQLCSVVPQPSEASKLTKATSEP